MVFPNYAAITAYDTIIWNAAGSGAVVVAYNVEIAVSSSPGTFAMRIAQNASSGGATVFEAGSWMEYMKVV
jgi:hypothetical protein